ncbi:hypothetical protein KAU15_04535, partial [candidate division WOR-3 bacterium]|nr:hypothetical protein [candidate division WOR-3 bacterium]
IMNNDKPIAIAGIMGGSNSEIDSESKTLFLESANFNAVNIRKTSSKLNLRTDSSSRFEKSLDPEFAYTAALRYAYLLKNIQPNIEFSSKLTVVNYNPFKRSIIEIKYDYIYSIIGVEISKKRIKDILESLMFDCECMGEYLIVKAPTFRSTKDIEIPADIIEEISRIYGYENIEPQLPIQRLTIPYNNTERNTENRIRNMLSYDYEMNETDSYIWFDNDFLKLINFVPNNHITLKNSVSLNNTILRTEMLPIMLKNVFENLKYTNAFSLYEMGPVFSGKSETQMLSIITVKEKSKNGDNTSFILLKNIINDVIHRLTNYNIDLVPLKDKVLLNPSNASSIEINKHTAGYMGTIHPSFNRLLDKKVNIAFAQIMVSSLILKKRTPAFVPYSQFPVSILDFSILKPLDETFESFTN